MKNSYLDIYITEINVNLLLNTCNFHRKFWLIFSLILSENATNVDFREAKFQNFPGGACPRTPLVYSRLWRSILFQPDQLCTASAGPERKPEFSAVYLFCHKHYNLSIVYTLQKLMWQGSPKETNTAYIIWAPL